MSYLHLHCTFYRKPKRRKPKRSDEAGGRKKKNKKSGGDMKQGRQKTVCGWENITIYIMPE